MVEMTRRNLLGAIGIGAGGLATGGALTACSGPAGSAESGTDFAMPTYQPAPDLGIEPFHASETPGMQNVYTEPVTDFFKSVDRGPGSGGTVTSFQLTWGEPSTPLDENPYWQELNERLGVGFEPTFVPQPTFDQKFSTMLASGEVPDLVFVNDQSAVNLQGIRDGAFADLSDVLAGDNILDWPNLAARKEDIWRASLKDGRVYQIPSTVWAITNVIVMRTDLLGQTSTGTAPADADQLLAALKAVTALGSGPGGQQVYGVNKYEPAMWRWIFKTGPDWRLGDDGKLVHVTQTDEYKDMLTWLAGAWSEGVFDPVAMTTNPADIVSGAAIEYRAVSNTFTGAAGLAQDEADLPGAKVDFFDVPGYDGTAPVIVRNIPYGRSTCVSAAAAEDEDRLVEILNVLDYLSAPYGSEEALFVGSGIEGRHYTFDENGIPVSTNEHTGELGVQYVGVVSGPNDYYGHPMNAAWAERFSTVLENMAQNSVARPLEGLETESNTFVTKGAQLGQLWDDFERGVVTGRESADDLESFVDDYMGRGGEQIRSEYERALEERGE
ncbi:extracellular solute-binding protein [Glycomyces arizonensis]|uniref:extracellular solute-binding protein n=1 Tax=Glycomyces arizonensis TaxID=256035 RepID=UPI0004274A8D|nr:extracellular solute-binding protein [Glycomyces arizonensis]